MMRKACCAKVAVLLVAFSSFSRAQERAIAVTGTVHDAAGRPVAYAWVNASATISSTATNEGGEFRLLFKQGGEFVVEVRRLGYEPSRTLVRATRDSATHIGIVLREITRTLDAITISATAPNAVLARVGFYERMLNARKGTLDGEFITPEELGLRQPQKVTQILNGIRGVKLVYDNRPGGLGPMPVSTRHGCPMTIYLDGARFQTSELDATASGGRGLLSGARPSGGGGGVGGRARGGPEGGLDGSIPANQVMAVEVYPSGTFAPAQFQLLNGTCGIIALWTKS